jgi:PAS domain S-box-containing protein
MSELTGDRVRELERLEELFHVVVETIDAVILVAAADLSTVEYVSPAYETLYGRPAETLCEEPWSFLDAVHPVDRDRYEADVRAMLDAFDAGDHADVYEGEYRLAGEEERWVHVRRYPVVEDGSVERFVSVTEDVTERKRAERGREEERRKYETLVEQSQDGVVVVQDGEYAFVNDRFCELTGRSRAELVGCPFDEVMAPEYRELVRERYEKRIAGEAPPSNYDVELRTVDGDRLDVELTVSHITHEGEPATMATFRDITERKRLERELREQQRRFELIANHIDEVIYLATADFSEILYINPAYEDVYGEPVESLSDSPTSFVEAAHPEDRAAYERDVEQLIADVEAGDPDETYEGEYRLQVDGETRWVRVMRSPVENDDGTVDRVVGTVSDVTDQRELERTYREVFESVSDGLVVHDPDTGEILDVNDRYCELTGYSHDELVGADIGLVMTDDPDYTEDRANRLIAAARDEGPQLFEWRGCRQNGETFHAEINLSVVEIRGRERVLASVRDVTERKRRQREFEQIFDGVNDLISVHDPDTGEILDVNDTYVDAAGYDKADILDLGVEGLTADVEGYSTARSREIISEVAETGESITVEWPVETADNERRWYEVNTTPARIGGDQRVLGISRDITERKRHERMMEALHEATERIQNASTAEDVCEATFEAAREVLDLSMPACWLHEADAGEEPALVPVAAPESAWKAPGGPGRFEPGSVGYDVFETGEMRTYDPSDRREHTPIDTGVLIPLGDHGLFGAAEPGAEEYDDAVVDAAHILARHATTALDRVSRAAERRESERRMSAILDRIDEAIFLTDAETLLEADAGSVYVSAGYEDVFGLSYADLAADESTEFVDLVHPEDREEYQAVLRDVVTGAADGADATDSIEYRIERPDGAVRWVHTDFYPLSWAGDDRRFVVVSRDITEEKEREATLETFHDATRELTAADSRSEASRLAVDAAERVLDFSHVSVHCYDEDGGVLAPVSATDALADTVDSLPSFGPGDGLPWQVFVDGETARGADFDAAGGYGTLPTPDLVLPLGTHGVMLVGTADAGLDAAAVDLAQILAATLEGALNHVQGQHELERREAALEEHRERAERLERLNTVIREIEQATVEESTRDAIERAVCEQLVTVDPYQVAWVAEPDQASESLVARTKRGADDGYVERTVDLDGADAEVDRHPAAAAFEEGETRTARGLATSTAQGDWRKAVLRAGYQSVVAVPLAHEDTVYGVLTIVADDPSAFDSRAEAILTELGRSVGYAISVLERRRALESDTTTELEFEATDDDLLFVRLAEAADADVTLERTVRRASGSFGAFYTVEGAAPEAVERRARALGPVADVTRISADEAADTCLVEVETSSWFGTVFVDHGAVVREATADETDGTLVVEAPQTADIRTLVTTFTERYPHTELVAQRTRERSVQTLLELQDLLAERLTPRQLETLETAYSAGYFEWPRESSGQEIADLLDITQPTFNKHLRTVERKTFSMLLNRQRPD